MAKNFSFKKIPSSRIATFDIFDVGLSKHHISAMLEFDVTETRIKLRELRKKGISVSFNAWLIKSIGNVLHNHPEAASYLYSKKKLIIFNDISVSFIVEKKIGDNKVPLPLVINTVNKKSAQEITLEIENAKNEATKAGDIVLNKETAYYQNLYYHLPGFLRRLFWRWLLRNPEIAFRTMGNVSVTSIGMIGRINGWFIHKSVHPISFGVGSFLRKPVVIDNEIKIREILNMTILVDHDLIDGAPMVRFLDDLTAVLENSTNSLI